MSRPFEAMSRPFDEKADREQRQQQNDRIFGLQVLAQAKDWLPDDAPTDAVLELAHRLRVWVDGDEEIR